MKRPLKRARAFVLDNWQVGLVILAGSAIAASLLLVQLGSLVSGLSADEFALQQRLANDQITFESLLKNPLFLPYYLGLYLMQWTPFSGPTTVRSIGALFGLMGALGFFYILNKWYTLRIALLGTALFATSSWFLHGARYASPEASYLLLPLLIAAVIALQSKTRSKLTVLAVLLFGLMAFYIPGIIWFLAPAVILQRRTIINALGLQALWFNIAATVLTITMLVPFATMIALNSDGLVALHNALGLLGLPETMPKIMDVLSNIFHNLGNIFAYSTLGPLYSPGHLPWLDVSTAALVLLGSVQFARHYKLDRSKLILVTGVVGLILSSINGPVGLIILLPFLYLLAVEGLKWLLDRWLQVFPRNPFARGFGVSAIVVLVLSTGVYQVNRYFLAWGQAPETQSQYNKLP